MFRKAILILLLALPLAAQNFVTPNPDCMIFFTFTATGTAPSAYPSGGPADNRTNGCQVWSLTYNVSGFTATANISIQSAPNSNGLPGTWVTYSGQTVIAGANPNTNVTTAMFATITGYQPWVRVSLNSVGAGAGIVSGALVGWKSLAQAPGGIASNVTIVGPLGQTTMSASIPVAIASDQSTLPVQLGGDAAVLSGQQAVTGSDAALGTNTAKAICVKALIGNTINVYVGPTGLTTATGMELAPGQAACVPVTNTNLVHVIASTTGASVSWIATN